MKICGLSTAEAVEAAVGAGADMIGFVFFAPSPRNVAPGEAGRLAALARRRGAVRIAALVVDADDALIAEIVSELHPDLVQLHGRETPERVAEIGRRFEVATMKALGIRDRSDLAAIEAYRGAADRILLDAKPPRGAALPGGNGVAFDWSLVAGLDLDDRFMLSGGLDAASVGAALAATGIAAVDVSSGVESAPGVKDPALIAAFVAAARNTA